MPPSSPSPGHPTLADGFAKLPLAFEQNVGQTDPQVRYLSRGPGFGLFLTDTAAVLSLARPGNPALRDVLKVQFTGTNSAATVPGQQQLTSRSNYFTGSSPAAWYPDVAQYAQVDYHNLYPGIDALYYGTSQRQLEYDLVVAPGAEPSAIQMNILGALGMQTDQQGNLLIQTAGGTVLQQAPVLYQLRQGARAAVSGRYTLGTGGAVGFRW